jgi:hypothetical protein
VNAEQIATALHARKAGQSTWSAKCVVHDDKTPSLSISESPTGQTLVHCHAGCDQGAVIAELKTRGLWHAEEQRDAPDTHTQLGKPSKFWDYRDEIGQVVLRIFRWDSVTGKTIRQASLQNGTWVWKSLPDKRPIYQLPKILAGTDKTILICEGEKAADAAATLFPEHVCTTWPGGAKAIGKADFSPLHGRSVILWPDNDEPGLSAMRELRDTLKSYSCNPRIADLTALGELPQGWDLADAKGFDVETLRACIDKASDKPKTRYTLMTGAELAQLPPLSWLIKNIFPMEGVAAIFGASGSGKSFLALDAACAIAEGAEWFSYSTKRAPVVYVSLEGEAGLKLRCDAWCKHNGKPLPDLLRFVLRQSFELTNERDIADLAEISPQGSVIFIDTLNRAAPMADENSGKDMGTILLGLKRLQELTRGLTVAIHHCGKDAGRGLRGHSSLHAALDAAIEVSADGDARQWNLYKSKDSSGDLRQGFKLEQIALGFDEDGDVATSCACLPVEAPTQKPKAAGKNQLVALTALREWTREHPDNKHVSSETISDLLRKQGIGRQRKPEVLNYLVSARVITPSVGGFSVDEAML